MAVLQNFNLYLQETAKLGKMFSFIKLDLIFLNYWLQKSVMKYVSSPSAALSIKECVLTLAK